MENIIMKNLGNIINTIIENTVNNTIIDDEKIIDEMKVSLTSFFTVDCLSKGYMSFSDGDLKISRRITSLDDVIDFINIIYYVIGDNEIYIDDINELNLNKKNFKINIGMISGRIWVGEFSEDEEDEK